MKRLYSIYFDQDIIEKIKADNPGRPLSVVIREILAAHILGRVIEPVVKKRTPITLKQKIWEALKTDTIGAVAKKFNVDPNRVDNIKQGGDPSYKS